ncbi:hypothetical protein, partial [Paenibacillus hemerocallicola]|uniref:hypothetical protein n=1 Tax=Paenibacillus hemerocallicola TaxID=1172614 RepID=UPI001C406709
MQWRIYLSEVRPLKQIKSNIELHTAAIDGRSVVVFLSNKLIDSGVIEEVTERAVKIKGEYYPR